MGLRKGAPGSNGSGPGSRRARGLRGSASLGFTLNTREGHRSSTGLLLYPVLFGESPVLVLQTPALSLSADGIGHRSADNQPPKAQVEKPHDGHLEAEDAGKGEAGARRAWLTGPPARA